MNKFFISNYIGFTGCFFVSNLLIIFRINVILKLEKMIKSAFVRFKFTTSQK